MSDTFWCPYHGTQEFTGPHAIVDYALTRSWNLDGVELEQINRSQGLRCPRDGCAVSMRDAVLARAIFDELDMGKARSVLEVNHAGNLTPWLNAIGNGGHILVSYPDVRMERLADDVLRRGSYLPFSIIVHSDVLEHVDDPLEGLKQCLATLRPGGFLAYTVPLLTTRQTRRRWPNEEPSCHGPDLVVTEYGADAWLQPMSAGFESVKIRGSYPDSFVLICRKRA